MKIEAEIIDWLLDGDPAIRWQVQRDLLGAKPAVYQKERAKIAKEGWGKQYLGFQNKNGTWGGGFYSPKWISTHYTLLTLRFLGLPPGNAQALKGCGQLLDNGFLEDHGINYTRSVAHAETCITGMTLSIASYFRVEDPRVDLIAEHLIAQQMGDHGWNCRSYKGDKHASFNTTLLVLEGLREYQNFRPVSKLPIKTAIRNGRVFLLDHRLYKSHRTGDIVRSKFTTFPSQPSWQYDILRAMDHFQATDANRDGRMQDAIEMLISKRGKDGRWPQYRPPSGKTYFTLEPLSKPSRWNTLRALRVLKWWNT